MKTLLSLLILALLSSACVVSRPLAIETTVGTNGVQVTRRLSLTTVAIWPATTTVEKQRASLGKTLSLGQVNLSEDTGGTNVVEALRAIDSILGKVR